MAEPIAYLTTSLAISLSWSSEGRSWWEWRVEMILWERRWRGEGGGGPVKDPLRCPSPRESRISGGSFSRYLQHTQQDSRGVITASDYTSYSKRR